MTFSTSVGSDSVGSTYRSARHRQADHGIDQLLLVPIQLASLESPRSMKLPTLFKYP